MAVERLLTDSDLYERDPHAWYFRQAALLRAGRVAEADVIHIAEELEDLGRSEAKELRSSLRLICRHMLKCLQQPNKRSKSGIDTMARERDDAALSLEKNQALRPNCRSSLLKPFYWRAEKLGETPGCR